MAKYVLNEDGSITFTIKGTPLVLEEPTMYQLSEMHRLVAEADTALGEVSPLPEDATDEEKATRRKFMVERTERAFSHDSPHGRAMVEIINMLAAPDQPYTEKDLPGWLLHPQMGATMLVHFRTPLPGEESSGETSEAE